MIRTLLLLLCLVSTLHANIGEITVDLKEPSYIDGVIETTQGGVIATDCTRIQACCITYTKDLNTNFVEASGDLMISHGEYIFVGKRLEFDFNTGAGVIYEGRTTVEPWYFGGEKIHLHPDGSFTLFNGFATTSENVCNEWGIFTEEACINTCHDLSAYNVQFRILDIPVFWMPAFHVNLDSIFDHPIRYTVRIGGERGSHFGILYEIFSYEQWRTFLRLDYFTKRGFGGGFETRYASEDGRTLFHSINYVANDLSIADPDQRTRYRFQGLFNTLLTNDKTTVDVSYDKLSDKDMATDYKGRGLQIEAVKRTQIHIRHQEEFWIANAMGRFRVNDFQTVNQEIPTIELGVRPFELYSTGIITQADIRASYQDFEYSNELVGLEDYNSTRLELSPLLYRPIHLGCMTLTPEVGGKCIYYANNPNTNGRWLNLALFGAEWNAALHRFYGNAKHVLLPYMRYTYLTAPSLPPDDHYIFDIDDGWARLNIYRFGLRQNLYGKIDGGCIHRYLMLDLWANAFFDVDPDKIPKTVPKAYAALVSYPTPTLKYTLSSAWDFNNSILDHFNIRQDWTASPDLALSVEYRHRSPYDWRKVDHTNFILDSFRDIDELRASNLSDKRDTLLFHAFYRFHHSWAFEFKSRHGWNRNTEPSYTEYEWNLIGKLRSAWNVKLSYRHQEDDKRFVFLFTIGVNRPDNPCCQAPVPLLDF